MPLNPKYYVPPSGDPYSLMAIVGEQPGRQEIIRRKVFVGPAGENLDSCLQQAEIPRSECYLTNVIKDMDSVLEDYIYFTTGKNRKGILTPEGVEYVEILRQELSNCSANIIVALGNVPLWVLTGRMGITNWRGSILDSTLLPGRKVIPTFHPATWTQEKLYGNPKAFLNRYQVVIDLQKAWSERLFPEIRQENRIIRIGPNYSEVLEFLSLCTDLAEQGKVIDYDIETVPGTTEVSCIGFSYSPNISMCIPFVGPGGDYFTLDQEATITIQIAKLLENPNIRNRGQNIIFDSHMLFRRYGIITRAMDDTMVAQKILYPELPVGLDFITSLWTDLPYYKKDGKFWLTGVGTWQQGWVYNCQDVLSCAIAHPKQIKELAEKGNLAAYERQIKLIEPLTYMMEHGIKIDIPGMERARSENATKIMQLDATLHEMMGKGINLNSPPQLCQYFYRDKRIQPYLDQKTHRPTVDIQALQRLASTHRLKEASLLIEYRKLTKQNSTFLAPQKIEPDGRIRCSYNPVGTRFSRISSSESIFETGMNLQNLPHEVLTYFVCDEGYISYGLDYSQYENRIVAYVGNILPMIQAFESGMDVHKLTASLVLTHMGKKTSYDAVSKEERQDYGKRPNHAFNYGYGPNSFALMHELPISVGRTIHSAYHAAYPGLKGGYWAFVQKCLREDRTLTNLRDRKVTFLGMWSDKLLHEAYSCIPQGTCGDCVNERGLIFTYYNSEFKPIEVLTLVHDSMDVQIPLSLPLFEHAKMLIRIREEMEIPLEFQGREFITPVDLVVNTCLNKDVGVELKGGAFSKDPMNLAQTIYNSIKQLEGKGRLSDTQSGLLSRNNLLFSAQKVGCSYHD